MLILHYTCIIVCLPMPNGYDILFFLSIILLLFKKHKINAFLLNVSFPALILHLNLILFHIMLYSWQALLLNYSGIVKQNWTIWNERDLIVINRCVLTWELYLLRVLSFVCYVRKNSHIISHAEFYVKLENFTCENVHFLCVKFSIFTYEIEFRIILSHLN